MKKNIYRHGELILKQIDELPEDVILEKETLEEVVAHSESGHNHILEVKEKADMSKMKFYTLDGSRFVELPQIAELWHKKSGNDVHKTLEIKPAIYKIIQKREFDYFARATRAVRD